MSPSSGLNNCFADANVFSLCPYAYFVASLRILLVLRLLVLGISGLSTFLQDPLDPRSGWSRLSNISRLAGIVPPPVGFLLPGFSDPAVLGVGICRSSFLAPRFLPKTQRCVLLHLCTLKGDYVRLLNLVYSVLVFHKLKTLYGS